MAGKKPTEAEMQELREAQKQAAAEAADALKNIVEMLSDITAELPPIYERLLMFDARAAVDTIRAQGELAMLRARCFELLNAALNGMGEDERN